jgi:acetyl esterase/lipase
MSQEKPQNELTKKCVVYKMPGVDAVTTRPDVVFASRGGEALTLDLYNPPSRGAGDPLPAVVIVAGYPDLGVQRILGCKFKDMGSTVSWARLMAASGLAAIAYANREPASDVQTLLRYIRANGASLGIDASRIGLWASSGNVPLALSLLSRDAEYRARCAVLCYGYMLDLEGGTGVAEAAARWKFVNPCAGKSISDLRRDVPLFLARAGNDATPGLNEGLDRFVAAALERYLPITLVNCPSAPHAFDLFSDTEASRAAIRQILAFLRFHLDYEPR